MFAENSSLIMFGLHILLPSIVRQQRFCNYGRDEMRDDSPKQADVNIIHCSIRIFYSTIISTNARKSLKKD